jgi:hypothetical protein
MSVGFVPLSQLPNLIAPARSGKKRTPSSIHRWRTRGVRGVHLQAWKLPDGWYTTLDAYHDFIRRLTEVCTTPNQHASPPPLAQPKPQLQLEAEIEAVRASLRKKKGGLPFEIPRSSAISAGKKKTTTKPRWDEETRELWFGDRLCKKFRTAAKNQEKILRTFQDLRWPRMIKDPFLPLENGDDQQRLRDTVHDLNQPNKNNTDDDGNIPCIRFELNGSGEGFILWNKKGPC